MYYFWSEHTELLNLSLLLSTSWFWYIIETQKEIKYSQLYIIQSSPDKVVIVQFLIFKQG